MSWKSWFTSELPSNSDTPQLLPVATSMSVHYFSLSLSVNLLGLQLSAVEFYRLAWFGT